MDEEETLLAVDPGTLGQEVPAGFFLFERFAGRFELGPRPEDGSFGLAG